MKTSPKRSYSVIENERFGLVFAKTVSIISGTDVLNNFQCRREKDGIDAQGKLVRSKGRLINGPPRLIKLELWPDNRMDYL